ncbi:MAG: TolC family protein, partial [Bacteroidota bacterium]
MKTTLKATIFLLLLTMGVYPAVFGQTDTLFLDREKALALALENNPGMAIARLEQARAEARFNETRGNLLPSLNA